MNIFTTLEIENIYSGNWFKHLAILLFLLLLFDLIIFLYYFRLLVTIIILSTTNLVPGKTPYTEEGYCTTDNCLDEVNRQTPDINDKVKQTCKY